MGVLPPSTRWIPYCRYVLSAWVMGWCLLADPAWMLAQDDPVESSESTPADPDEVALPKLKDMIVPSVAELLTGPQQDWIILSNDDVLVVESLIPRPGTLQAQQQKIAAKEAERKGATVDQRDKIDAEIEELQTLLVSLAQGGDRREYRLPLRLIKEIVHHEDLMLRKLQEVVEEKKLDQAYELLNRLKRQRPDWEGVDEASQNVIRLTAEKRLQEGQAEAALLLLRELHAVSPNLPQLRETTGQAIKSLVDGALANADELKAQFYLNQLRGLYADHPVFQEYARQLGQRAEERMQAAVAAASKDQHRQAMIIAEDAVRIWPPHPNLRGSFQRIAQRYPRLHVGVTELPGQAKAYPFPTLADERRDQLTRMTLFEVDRVRDGTAYYRTRFFDEWEPRDLGRQIRLTLRQFRQPSDLQAVVTTREVMTPILQSLDSGHPNYSERLATWIDSVEVRSPTEIVLTFRHVPPRIEPLLANLALPIPDVDRSASELFVHPGGFQLVQQTPEVCEYVRSLPEPDGLARYHIAEVVEHRYSSPQKLVQALLRGEVSMASRLPDVELRALQDDDSVARQFFIQPFAQPQTHLIQFNPETPALKIRELRAGLAFAIDRNRLLREVVLEDPEARHGRLITTPFSSKHPGRSVAVQQRRFDLSTALALILAARQKLKGPIPPLTMIVAPGDVPTAAAEEMARTWRAIGLEVQLVGANDPPPEHWDLIYRTLEMREPVLELWPLLTVQDQARVKDLALFPDWLQQELIRLDRTGDQSLAVDALQRLHRQLWENASLIPLWEIDQFVVLRKNIQRFPARFVHCYDQIDRWIITPWYQTELP